MGAASITYLSTTIGIGHETITLQTDHFPDLSGAKPADGVNALKQKIRDGIAFKMAPGETVSINLGSMVDWINGMGTRSGFTWPPVLKQLLGIGAKPAALDDVSVVLCNLSVNTKGSLSFSLRVKFADSFGTDLGIPDAVANVFKLDALGLGFSYE